MNETFIASMNRKYFSRESNDERLRKLDQLEAAKKEQRIKKFFDMLKGDRSDDKSADYKLNYTE